MRQEIDEDAPSMIIALPHPNDPCLVDNGSPAQTFCKAVTFYRPQRILGFTTRLNFPSGGLKCLIGAKTSVIGDQDRGI